MTGNFDYVIIGGGTAGCLLANRLSEDPATRVLLLEAGPKPKSMWIKIPAGVSQLIFPGRFNWGYSTEPEPNLNGRTVYAPRGKTLGGSSAINGMAYVRGHRDDFEGWRQLGNAGWGWDEALAAYKAFERFEGGCNPDHGGDGELAVTSPRVKHPSSSAFIQAGAGLGLAVSSDLNGAEQDGTGFLHFSIRDGQRVTTADAFLTPAQSRANLKVETEALVRKIVIENGRATGVGYRRGGQDHQVSAAREVILSTGTFDSPKLLMLSGVGPAEALRAQGIEVVADLPGVGRNLQDHLYVHSTFRTTAESSLNGELRGWKKYLHGAIYMLTRKGLLTMGASQACAFVRGLPGASRPDLQIMFRPVSWEFSGFGTLEIGSFPAVGMSMCQLRPQSRGRVELRSAQAEDSARIYANYLDSPADRDAVVAGVRWMRRLSQAEPLTSRIVETIAPKIDFDSDFEIMAYARETAQSVHHWVGSCKMGIDAMAVVDPELRVRGIECLRVVDASIMPTISSGNTAAPVMMIAQKGAALIKAAGR